MPDPPQLDGPQQDDLDTLDWYPINTSSTVCIYVLPFSPESSDPLPRVTEEMLRAEFYIPDTTDEPLCTRLTIQCTCACLLLPNYFIYLCVHVHVYYYLIISVWCIYLCVHIYMYMSQATGILQKVLLIRLMTRNLIMTDYACTLLL